MNDFLPQNYEVPQGTGGSYMKFQIGANKFRILGSFTDGTAIMGNEYWVTDSEGKRKPVRVPMDKLINTAEIEEDVKHFWALPVYNHNAKVVQILEITQKGIMNAIKEYARNEDWGDPRSYDIVVTKSGEGMETKYTLMPSVPKPLPVEADKLVKATKIVLTELFAGGDPFKPTNYDTTALEDIDIK